MTKQRPSTTEWLGFSQQPDFTKARWLGVTIGFSLSAICLVLVFITIVGLFQISLAIFGAGPFSGGEAGAGVRNLGFLLATLIGAPFLLWRSWVAQKQADIAEQGHITDRITKAIDGLGSERTVKRQRVRQNRKLAYEHDDQGNPDYSRPIFEEITAPNLEVRLGAIYALERISQDSPRDHIQIMETLCAYVRENAKAESLDPTEIDEVGGFKFPLPRIDIQTIITVLGRRRSDLKAQEAENAFRLDLSGADLTSVRFNGGDFSAAKMHRCRLEGASFDDADLSGTQFFGSLMNYASFRETKIKGTRMDFVAINNPRVNAGQIRDYFITSDIHSVTFVGADLSAVDHLYDDLRLRTFGTADTVLDDETNEARKNLRDDRQRLRKARHTKDEKAEKEALASLGQSGFLHWSHLESNDLAIGQELNDFLDAMGLKGWPFRSS